MTSPIVNTDNQIFTPPFLGERHIKGLSLSEIVPFLNETSLFRMQWGYRPDKSINETDKDFRKRIQLILNEWLHLAKTKNILIPAVAYGYFAVNSEGDDLIVWKDETKTQSLVRFTFPRQAGGDQLCIADFFRSVESKEMDYAAFSIATMGELISQETSKLFSDNSYSDYLHLHGLGVELTEALAEYFHKRIRQEWGFDGEDDESIGGLFRQKYRGGRYSWGYPACPDLEDNKKVADLLDVEKLGVEVSEETSWQFHPEQTTSAIICHHPQAKYFNTP